MPERWQPWTMASRSTLPESVKELVASLEHHLIEAGSDTPAQDARYIIFKRTGMTWADLITNPSMIIDSRSLEEIRIDLDSALKGIPLSRIYGERAFWGRNFEISTDTLDPRADTETLVKIALERFRKKHPARILDLGTGSGCILLSLLCEFEDSYGIGVDRASGALQTAKRNAILLGRERQSAFICGDWGDSLSGKFDLVVSNPPYISNRVIPTLSETVRKYDPILALDGGDDGLHAYRQIFSQLPALLKPGGVALFEIGFDQNDSVMRLSRESGFPKARIHADSGGLPRVLEIFYDHPCGDK